MEELVEPWMNSVLKDVFKVCEGTFLDIGVNLGQTLLHVKTLEPARKYIGFEPNPTCCFYANSLIEFKRVFETLRLFLLDCHLSLV